jgi:hypothetical protein
LGAAASAKSYCTKSLLKNCGTRQNLFYTSTSAVQVKHVFLAHKKSFAAVRIRMILANLLP